MRRSKDKPLPDLDDPLVVKAKKMKTIYMVRINTFLGSVPVLCSNNNYAMI